MAGADHLSLLYALDAGFEELALLSLASFLLHNKFRRVYCATSSEYDAARLASLCDRYGQSFVPLPIPDSHPITVLSPAVQPYFYCIAAIDMIPPDAGSVLYADADTLCVSSLETLANLQLNGEQPVAACSHGRPMLDRQLALGLASAYHYFNAGLLLFNPATYPEMARATAVIDYYLQHEVLCRFREQCALNSLLKHRVAFLPSSYNYLSWMRPRLSDHIWQNPLHNPFAAQLEHIRSSVKIAHLSARALPSLLPVDRLEPLDRYWLHLRERLIGQKLGEPLLTFADYVVSESSC
jgi:lipopolysaccharide biosynthesis glycosyltransferase